MAKVQCWKFEFVMHSGLDYCQKKFAQNHFFGQKWPKIAFFRQFLRFLTSKYREMHGSGTSNLKLPIKMELLGKNSAF